MRARGLVLLALVGGLLLCPSCAFAGGWWRVASRAAPSDLPAGGEGTVILSATNVGDGTIDGSVSPVVVKDTLPEGVQATAIEGAPAFEELEEGHRMSCVLATLTCSSAPELLPAFQALDVTIHVKVKADAASGQPNSVSVSGGEQQTGGGEPAPVGISEPLTISPGATPFGLQEDGYRLTPELEGGGLDTQAGGHPFQLTTTLDLNETTETVREIGPVAAAPALPKQLQFNLPPGLVGDPLAVPRCPGAEFQAVSPRDTNGCAPDTAIGVAVVTLNEPAQFHNITRAVPLWNLEAAKGEPARFGFEVLKVPVVLDTTVRSSGDYGVTVTVDNAPQATQLLSSEVTIWGAPGDSAHDASRGWDCLNGGEWVEGKIPCHPEPETEPKAFLDLPGSCAGPLTSTVTGSSWPVQAFAGEPGVIFTLQGPQTQAVLPAMAGCEEVPFTPQITISGEHRAATPTPLEVDVHIPQATTISEQGIAESDLRSATVTLPEGVQLNPASANGLTACSEAQAGYEGPGSEDPLAQGTPTPDRFNAAPASCPEASKVASVTVNTPLLERPLTGWVYLATQNQNPFGSLIALYIVIEDPYSGIRVKLAGEVHLDPATGRISSTFQTSPQVPFEDFHLNFFGGPRASVATPISCGAPQTEALFTPWASPTPTVSTSPLQVTEGTAGIPCAEQGGLSPTLIAGSEDPHAGAFSPFTLALTHRDQDQPLTGLSLTLPEGAAAVLASTTPCPEPQASLGQCGPESEIASATASAGDGPDPYTETGHAYITGPYQGAPFGLSIATPAVAGPFNLGLIIVRSTIQINPTTAQVTIGTPIPTYVKGIGQPPTGIPLALKEIRVNVNRPGFEFNPTSCKTQHIQGIATGQNGQSTPLAAPYQTTGCQTLPFHPKLTATAQGHATKQNGTSLTIKVQSQGLGVSNIAKVDLALPGQLPSRQSTLSKACTTKTFEANPALCPPESIIGTATIHTPILKNPLTGPAYLVSHGNAAFPDVEFLLQGENITILLDGQTDIKKGVTYSRFETTPDAPFTTFETHLPAGPHSILTAYANPKNPYNLCPTKLTIPTQITAQNNTLQTQNTPITLTGCPKHKPTPQQQLKTNLKHCHTTYPHNPKKRHTCEHQAHTKYKTTTTRAHNHSKGRRR